MPTMLPRVSQTDSEARNAAFDAMPIGVVVASRAGVVLHCNPFLTEILGRPRETLVGNALSDLLAPEDRERVLSRFARRLSGEYVVEQYICKALAADDRRRDVEISVKLGVDDVVVLVRDVTDAAARRERRIEFVRFSATLHALRNTTEILSTFRAGLSRYGVSAVWSVPDGDGLRVRFADIPATLREPFEAQSGLNLERFVGRWSRLGRAAWTEGHGYSDEAHKDTAEFLGFEHGTLAEQLVLAGGLHHAVAVRLHTHGAPSGVLTLFAEWLREEDVPSVQMVVQQVDAALDAAEEIVSTRERLDEAQAVRDLARAVAATLDLDEILRVGIEAVCKTLGTSSCFVVLVDPQTRTLRGRISVGLAGGDVSTESIALDARSFAAECYRQRAPVVSEDAANDPRVRPEMVERFHGKSLLAVPMMARDTVLGVMVTDEVRRMRTFTPQDVAHAMLVADQLSIAVENARLYADLRKSYAQLEAAQSRLVRQERLAALGELSAVVAHEVRNPLGVIFNSMTSLERLLSPTGDARVLFSILREEADRLNRIVRDLLEFARPARPSLREERLDRLLDESVSAAMVTEGGPVIRLERAVAADIPPVLMDPRLIRQVVVNLAQNALHAMPRGGTLTVRAGADGRGGAWFELEDTGGGIPPDVLPRIFEPFFTTRATGTGLGLAVVRRIVETHGGDIQVRSTPGAGSTFTVRLPLTQIDA